MPDDEEATSALDQVTLALMASSLGRSWFGSAPVLGKAIFDQLEIGDEGLRVIVGAALADAVTANVNAAKAAAELHDEPALARAIGPMSWSFMVLKGFVFAAAVSRKEPSFFGFLADRPDVADDMVTALRLARELAEEHQHAGIPEWRGLTTVDLTAINEMSIAELTAAFLARLAAQVGAQPS